MKPINLPLASSAWDKAEIDAIHSVIARDRYTMGESVAAFEKQFAKHFGARYAVMVNSGSSANLLAIAALCQKSDNPLQPGDEVIVPSLSWSTTYYPVHQHQMKLIFVDIDINSLNMDLQAVEKAITPKTRAIFVPNILGNPAQLPALQALCRKHHLYLIEDNCESMGAKLDKQFCGTFGIAGTFSCFFSHHISTMEGGVIVTNDEELYHIMLSMRSHGWTRHLPQQSQLHVKSENPFYESFNFILPGYNIRPLEMSGAIGIEQLKKLDKLVKHRRENAAHFTAEFSQQDKFIIQAENGESSWFGFSLIIKPETGLTRERVLQQLDQLGVEYRPIISGNFLRHAVIKKLDHRVVGTHSNADMVHDYGFFIGNQHYDIRPQITELASALKAL